MKSLVGTVGLQENSGPEKVSEHDGRIFHFLKIVANPSSKSDQYCDPQSDNCFSNLRADYYS